MNCIQIQRKKNSEFLNSVSKEKGIIFAVMCIERQMKVYEKACTNYKWNNESFFKQVLDACLEYAVEQKEFQKNILELCDKYMPENIEPSKPMDDATLGATNVIISIISLIKVIINNDKDTLLNITLENINFIKKFLYNYVFNIIPSDDIEEATFTHELIKEELVRQEIDKNIISINSIKHLKKYYYNQKVCSILGEYWY